MQETIATVQRRIVDSLTFVGQNAMVQDFLVKTRLTQPHAMWWYMRLLEDFNQGKRDILLYAAADKWAQRELWHGVPFDPSMFNPKYEESSNEANNGR